MWRATVAEAAPPPPPPKPKPLPPLHPVKYRIPNSSSTLPSSFEESALATAAAASATSRVSAVVCDAALGDTGFHPSCNP